LVKIAEMPPECAFTIYDTLYCLSGKVATSAAIYSAFLVITVVLPPWVMDISLCFGLNAILILAAISVLKIDYV